jgi:hypothetical protein
MEKANSNRPDPTPSESLGVYRYIEHELNTDASQVRATLATRGRDSAFSTIVGEAVKIISEPLDGEANLPHDDVPKPA